MEGFFWFAVLALIVTSLVLVAGLYLLIQFWLWRKRGWHTAHWGWALWAGLALSALGGFGLWQVVLGFDARFGPLFVLAGSFLVMYALFRFRREQDAIQLYKQQTLTTSMGTRNPENIWPPPPNKPLI